MLSNYTTASHLKQKCKTGKEYMYSKIKRQLIPIQINLKTLHFLTTQLKYLKKKSCLAIVVANSPTFSLGPVLLIAPPPTLDTSEVGAEASDTFSDELGLD